MSAPRRIQRKRTKGWRMPEGAIYVGRPSRWGNPFTYDPGNRTAYLNETQARRRARDTFRGWLDGQRYWFGPEAEARRDAVLGGIGFLRGHDLVCWCPLDQPCHADVLLELANA
jgi:hypothetical protein